MIFDIVVTGEFSNVKGLRMDQHCCMKIQCGSCNEIYPNVIEIDSKAVRAVKVKEKPKKMEYYNLVVECKKCSNKMCIDIVEPEGQTMLEKLSFEQGGELDESNEEYWISPVINDTCHILTIKSDSAVVKSIENLMLDAVSENKNVIFNACDFSKRTLAEDNLKGSTVEITNFLIKVIERSH